MKTLFKILLTLFVLFVVVLGVAYFAATRPGLQKRLIEAQLPEGSSIERVHIRPKNLSLRGVDIQMPDGSSLQLGRLESGFSPLAAVFDQTIRLSGLEVEGLVVQVPKAKVDEPRPPQGTAGSSGQPTESVIRKAPPAPDATAPASAPTDALYALGQLEWLFDIDSINVQGVIIDVYENRFSFNVESGQIAPGLESDLEASLSLESKEAMQGGLQEFASEVRLQFKQNETGGFESLVLDSTTSGSDASGASLLSASQTLTLQVDARGGNAEMKFGVNVDLPRPGVFLPELASLTGAVLQAEMRAAADGPVLTLNEARLDLSAGDQPIAKINLEQALTLGAEQQFGGRLMTVDLISLPLAWLNPWLGDGLQLSGPPVAAQLLLQGGSDGSLEVHSGQTLRWGPFSLSQSGQPLIDQVTLAVDPSIRIDADQTVHYDLQNFELADRYGAFSRGSVSGQKGAAGADALFAGITTEAKLEVGLAEVLQQPALAGQAGVLAGQARLQLSVDEAAEFPVRFQASVDSLRARSLPGSRQDYRLAAQLKRSESGTYALGTNLQAGLESRPTTTVQLGGQVQPDRSPLPFKVDLNAPSVRQRDLDILLAALSPQETATAPATADPAAQRPGAAPGPSGRPSDTGAVVRPPWANLDGSANVRIDELTLNSGQLIRSVSAQAEVKEALFEIREIKASLEDGQIAGRARVDFDAARPIPYTISSQLNFENVDPAVFSQRPGGAFPVRGLFKGAFDLEGGGPTLQAALANSDAALRITGREGVLTAFELDSRSQLGLLGAGILGQQLDRPGITAMAEAVPYFKDMRFESFTLNLTRGQDKVVRIPELSFLGDNLRIEGQGLVAASRLDEVLKQPLQLSLSLGAKGRLVDYLETLQLLGPQTGPDGFRDWKRSIDIGGTLGDPDTSALKDMLTEAARRAIRGRPAEEGANPDPESGSNEAAQPAPAEKTKQERRRDEIDMGLDLLNSVFGN
jgi:hypothetical protein